MKEGSRLLVVTLVAAAFVVLGFYTFFQGSDINPLFAPSETAQAKISIKNSPPEIISINSVPVSVVLTELTTTPVSVIFTAYDKDKIVDMVFASATFTMAGEPDELATCVVTDNPSIRENTYTCTANMQYYTKSGDWGVLVYVEDTAGQSDSDSTATFYVEVLKSISLTPTSIDFGTGVSTGATNLAGSNTVITNRGNFETAIDGDVSIIGADLEGVTDSSESIPAPLFRVSDVSGAATVCTSGTVLSTGAEPTDIILTRGISGSGEVAYCLTSVPEISAQDYAATWTIQI